MYTGGIVVNQSQNSYERELLHDWQQETLVMIDWEASLIPWHMLMIKMLSCTYPM